MKSKELKVYNLPVENSPIDVLDAKPYELLIGIFLFGVAITFTNISIILGSTLVVVSCFSILFLPKSVLIEFYNDHMILHNKASKEDCMLIYYEDIVSYEYKRGSFKDYLFITLTNETTENIDAFSEKTLLKKMNRFCPNKNIIK